MQDQCEQQEAWIHNSCVVVKGLKRKIRELEEAAKAPRKLFVPSNLPPAQSFSDSEVHSSTHKNIYITTHINLLA
jgi:hypothetical protein